VEGQMMLFGPKVQFSIPELYILMISYIIGG
jgi:hypothetical protein